MEEDKRMFLNIVTKTDGKGYWTKEQRTIKIKKMILSTFEDENNTNHYWGSLDVYFDPKDWSTFKHGLIYTDLLWLETFKLGLVAKGFSPESLIGVHYSEQGLQWKTFVNLDVDSGFIDEFNRLNKSS